MLLLTFFTLAAPTAFPAAEHILILLETDKW